MSSLRRMTFLGGGRACIGFKFSQLEMSTSPCVFFSHPYVRPDLYSVFSEVVLVTLLSKFKFAPSNRDVYWNLAGIQYPTVGQDSLRPELPMKVEFLASS